MFAQASHIKSFNDVYAQHSLNGYAYQKLLMELLPVHKQKIFTER